MVQELIGKVDDISPRHAYGRVTSIQGHLVEVAGPLFEMSVGSMLTIHADGREPAKCEVVGFSTDRALCLPFSELDGIRLGCRAVLNGPAVIRPTKAWLGRMINAHGEPIDGKGPLPRGHHAVPLRRKPPAAHKRTRVGGPMDLGVRALNTFITLCQGQRMGIFAGSGVGKSVLLSMLARNASSEVNVIGLIGERGREVQEFVEDDLGEEGLKRSIVVVATSDEMALMRRQAAYLTLALAEYFREDGKQVLCMMDSVTRFAQAQREIGLAAGEPPTSKGYTPTVFAELPKLLERAGPGEKNEGAVTGLFTVLVEGDNHNEPVADAVRGILDGHIVMERAIAERGRYPAINILKSVSRTLPNAADPAFWPSVLKARQHMATYSDMEELIRLGAYRQGSDPSVDLAIALHEPLEAFLSQGKGEATSLEEGYQRLEAIVGARSEQGNTGL
ncbi:MULTISPECIES: flagellar protein export ATPase FliI [Cohaesibacter]|uniref:flagellar protein export ATPase FliI n=1 Tax=Cohaesibacter TaxID=655352 RepID=UPI000DEA5E5C|nr:MULTISPECIES: flagellar protein export ATPase FliI [Cohaesibacter]TLP48153.1 flagellar protein export ATPase FliI [Cohaesibacter sp. CAU 1516]